MSDIRLITSSEHYTPFVTNIESRPVSSSFNSTYQIYEEKLFWQVRLTTQLITLIKRLSNLGGPSGFPFYALAIMITQNTGRVIKTTHQNTINVVLY